MEPSATVPVRELTKTNCLDFLYPRPLAQGIIRFLVYYIKISGGGRADGPTPPPIARTCDQIIGCNCAVWKETLHWAVSVILSKKWMKLWTYAVRGFRKCSGDILMCQGCSAMITGRGTAIVISKITCSPFFSSTFCFYFLLSVRSVRWNQLDVSHIFSVYDVSQRLFLRRMYYINYLPIQF